jgi:hypothetical protein
MDHSMASCCHRQVPWMLHSKALIPLHIITIAIALVKSDSSVFAPYFLYPLTPESRAAFTPGLMIQLRPIITTLM